MLRCMKLTVVAMRSSGNSAGGLGTPTILAVLLYLSSAGEIFRTQMAWAGFLFLALAASTARAAAVGNNSNPCPFGPGICPTTIDNLLDVFYFDVTDEYSCQERCKDIQDCHFFTMYGVHDSPRDHMKCFAFRSCQYLDPCEECTTGPVDLPMPHPVPPCDDPNYICETSRQNILDVDYFDVKDDFSCHHQCTLEADCKFWTELEQPNQPKHKCFLFKDCKTHEPCDPNHCTTGSR